MQLHMLINCQLDAAKLAPNTKRYKFACSKLQIIKIHDVQFIHFKKLGELLS